MCISDAIGISDRIDKFSLSIEIEIEQLGNFNHAHIE